jgi:hypothetical protein
MGMIGETRWQKGMSWFFKPFTKAEVRYFQRDQAGQAHAWILEGLLTPAS